MNSFTFLFEAMKETHEQRKAKIDIDEFRSGTTNITQTIKIPIFDFYNRYLIAINLHERKVYSILCTIISGPEPLLQINY